jgi:hypothetical protein
MNASSTVRKISVESLLPDLTPHTRYGIHCANIWLSTYIECFDRQKSALILDISHTTSREWLGALLLDVNKSRGTRFFFLRRLLPLGFGPSDFFDIPCQAGMETQVADSLADWLSHHTQEWDSMHLDFIPESSRMWQPLVDALTRHGLPAKVTKDRKFFFVETNGDWEAYDVTYFHAKNKDLKKDMRRIEREGYQVRLVEIRSGIANYLPQLFSFYGARREIKGQADVFDAAEWRAFLSDVIEKFEAKGWVRLSLLLDQNEEIWAHQLDWLMDGVRYHYFHSINEKFRAYSPGKVLLYLILKNAFADSQIKQCNFMRGESPYKENFANQTEAYVKIEVQNPKSYRNRLLKIATRIADARDRILK